MRTLSVIPEAGLITPVWITPDDATQKRVDGYHMRSLGAFLTYAERELRSHPTPDRCDELIAEGREFMDWLKLQRRQRLRLIEFMEKLGEALQNLEEPLLPFLHEQFHHFDPNKIDQARLSTK